MAGTIDVEDLQKRLARFAAERDWDQFHTPKNLAMALAAEAGELAAEFQWLTPEQSNALDATAKARVTAEMADVFIHLVRLADKLAIDLQHATLDKIEENARRYPVAEARGNARKSRR